LVSLNIKKSLASCLLLNTIFHAQLVSAQNVKTQALPDAGLLNSSPVNHLRLKSPHVFVSGRQRVSLNHKSLRIHDMMLTKKMPRRPEGQTRRAILLVLEAPSAQPTQNCYVEVGRGARDLLSRGEVCTSSFPYGSTTNLPGVEEWSDRLNTVPNQNTFTESIHSVGDILPKPGKAENLGMVELTSKEKHDWNQAQQDFATPESSNPEVDDVLNELDALPQQGFPLPVDTGYRSSPGFTISNPNGYGSDNNTIFLAADYQKRTRFTRKSDGELGFGVGLGNSIKAVGVEFAYTINSFGTSRSEFGSGAFSIKVHRRIAEDIAVAVGWNQFARIERNPDAPLDYPKNSYYAVATKIFKTQEFIDEPFSRLAVTVGIGSGQFLNFDRINQAFIDDEAPTGLAVFGSVGVRVVQPVSMIVEWTGQDLGAGLSIVPFKNIPLVITPAVRDITGAGDGARFILGTGISWQL
jgi:hypothetical protein